MGTVKTAHCIFQHCTQYTNTHCVEAYVGLLHAWTGQVWFSDEQCPKYRTLSGRLDVTWSTLGAVAVRFVSSHTKDFCFAPWAVLWP